jgi:hypothetical protein
MEQVTRGRHRAAALRTTGRLLLCLVMAAGLAACANKAKVLQAGAVQFEAESLAAIERIDELRRSETAVTPPPPEAAVETFARLVEGSRGPISRADLRLLTDPDQLDLPGSEAAWQGFLATLRLQYTTFSATFANLDKGSLFAAPAVEEAAALIDPLIGQMTAFAKSIGEQPAEFVRERAIIAEALEAVRDDASLTPVQRRKDLSLLRQRLVDVAAAEERVTREAIAQCLQSARLGLELRKLLLAYDTLTVDDLADGVKQAFALASVLPGLDLGALKGDTDKVIEQINADPQLEGFLNKALGDIQLARGT